MNEQAANALYEAERKGVKQIRGELYDGEGGFCTSGWLQHVGVDVSALYLVPVAGCPLCGAMKQTMHDFPIEHEHSLIVHLNNDHGLTFSEIARKLGPDAA